jgi:hypothetical protein
MSQLGEETGTPQLSQSNCRALSTSSTEAGNMSEKIGVMLAKGVYVGIEGYAGKIMISQAE